MYRTVAWRCAISWPTLSSRVDFPTPGSPATNTTWPETSPPPKTRSNSDNPVGERLTFSARISLTLRAGRLGALAAERTFVPAVEVEATSVTVSNSWHFVQRPTQRKCVASQAEQRKEGEALAMLVLNPRGRLCHRGGLSAAAGRYPARSRSLRPARWPGAESPSAGAGAVRPLPHCMPRPAIHRPHSQRVRAVRLPFR